MSIPSDVSDHLVFDIGLHSGDDAAYYMSLGYRVIGVEANPLLAERCRERFSEPIERGQMTVVNAGVLREDGVFTFYRNLEDDGWSSFQPERTRAGRWEELQIPCMTTRHLIEQYGRPFFMKVDIEGADLQALSSLTNTDCPPYISLELNDRDPIVETLIELGYTAFKFVDGERFWSSTPIFEHQIAWRVLRKLGRVVPSFGSFMRALPEPLRRKSEWNPPGPHNPHNYPFTGYSSGPFGEYAAGKWKTSDAALRWFKNLCKEYRKAGQSNSLWWDVHARHSSVSVGSGRVQGGAA